MYYVFLLRVIKLLACFDSLTRLLHAEWHKKPLHVHDFAPSRMRILNTESEKIVLAEFGIFRGFGIWNTAKGIRNPTNDWNPEPNFHWQRLESSTWNTKSTDEESSIQDSLAFPYMGQNRRSSTSVLGPFHCYRRNDANVPQWFIILLAPSYY